MAMQKLNVRFSDETKDKISKASKALRCSDSELARAAINIGILTILELRDSIHISAEDVHKEIGRNQ